MAKHRRIYYQVGYWSTLSFVVIALFFGVFRPAPNGISVFGWLIAPLVLVFFFGALGMGILLKGQVKEVGGNLIIWYEVLFIKKEIRKKIIPIKSIEAFAIGEGRVPGGFIRLNNSKNMSYDLRMAYPIFDDLTEITKKLESIYGIPILHEGPYYILGPKKAKRSNK
jgi:hypothetical protein